jgi:4'-phosphopantetheinyl transferase EntD
MTEEALEGLISRFGVAASAVRAGEHPLFKEEAVVVARAVASRRGDFAAGRTAARRALSKLGMSAIAIPSGPRRAPVWPQGIVGSISHSGGWAVAAVARAAEFESIGVDIEVAAPLPADVAAVVVGPEDRLGTHERRATIAFSAKESVYKALQPARGWLLEFGDVALELHEGTFTAIARSTTVRGFWAIESGMIATLVTL